MDYNIQDKLAYLKVCREASQHFDRVKKEYYNLSKNDDNYNSNYYSQLLAISSSQAEMYKQMQNAIIEDLINDYSFARYTQNVNAELGEKLKLALERTKKVKSKIN